MNRKTDGNPAMARAIDHDQIFKNLLKNFFKEFMELFLPDAAEAINFRRITFLEKEYFTDASGGKRKQMDLVVRAGLKGGGEEFILVHTEFQATKDMDFARRMYEYYSQLYLRYGKPIIPVAIFADDAKWRKPVPDTFKVGFRQEVYVNFKYRQIKLKDLDYRKYLRSKNPLAYALMAKMGYDHRQMVQTKSEFCRLIAGSKKINPARRYLLMEFVEAYMQLNSREQKEYDQMIDEQEEFKEVKKMITVYEKRGIEQGIEQGVLEGKKEALLLLLKSRFGFIDNALEDDVMHISSVAKVERLLKKAAVVDDIKNLKL